MGVGGSARGRLEAAEGALADEGRGCGCGCCCCCCCWPAGCCHAPLGRWLEAEEPPWPRGALWFSKKAEADATAGAPTRRASRVPCSKPLLAPLPLGASLNWALAHCRGLASFWPHSCCGCTRQRRCASGTWWWRRWALPSACCCCMVALALWRRHWRCVRLAGRTPGRHGPERHGPERPSGPSTRPAIAPQLQTPSPARPA